MKIDCTACDGRGHIVANLKRGPQRRTCRRCKGAGAVDLAAYAEAVFSRSARGDGCWEWGRARTDKGYGSIRILGRLYRAHRLAWEVTHGPVPNGLLVCHRCDNPRCVRPDHLFLGTAAENTADMLRKGRGRQPAPRRGEQHHNAGLTEGRVREIRRAYARGGITQKALGEHYGTTEAAVGAIVRGRSWKHMGDT